MAEPLSPTTSVDAVDSRPAVAGEGGGRRLVANAGFRSLAEIGSKVATFALFAVLGRKLGDGEFGIFSFALSISTLATTLADFGQDKVLTREVARDPDQVESFYGNTLTLRLIVGVPVLCVVVALIPVLGYGPRTQAAVLLVGLAVLAELLTTTCFAIYQAFDRMAYMPVVLVTERWLTAAAGIVVVLAGGSVVAVAAVFLASALFGLGLAAHLLRTRVVPARITVEPSRWWPLMRAALPLGIAGVFGSIFFRIDMTMLAAYKNAAAVGNYGVAYRLFETTLFLSYSVVAGAYPVFARLATGDDRAAARLFTRTLKLGTALVAPLAVGAAVLASPVVRLLFGDDFRTAPGALVILALPIATYPASYIGGYLLIARNRERSLVIVYGFLAIENIVGNAILIPVLSARGAAWSTAITQTLAAIIVLWLARKAVGPFEWRRAFASAAVAAGAAAAVMFTLHAHLFAAVGAGALVYGAVFLILEGVCFPEDAASFRALLRRGPQV